MTMHARLFLTLLLPEMTSRVAQRDVEQLASTYLSFLWDAFDQETKRFRNFMSHSREWLEKVGSEDSHARALWAVEMALGRSRNDGHRNLCALLFQRGLPVVEQFTSPRAWAFVLLAMQEYLRSFSGDRTVNQLRDLLTTRLLELFQANSSKEWQWFEPVATYDNARLRSIYNPWRRVLEYFDAYLISLTATPSKQTIGFFTKNLVKEDEHERPSPTRSKSTTTVYKIDTEITKGGSRVEKSFYVDNATASPAKSAVNNSTRSGLRV